MKKFFAVISILALSLAGVSAFAAEKQEEKIVSNCASIKEKIVNLQHEDSKTRVNLGKYYESILSDYIVPLNLRLVENNISNSELVENQGDYKAYRQNFIDDYISYQQNLEDLASANCEENPSQFMEKIVNTRAKRKIVATDVLKMKGIISKQVSLVKKLKEGVKE